MTTSDDTAAAAFLEWLPRADAWLDADPQRRAQLEAWESEFVTGDASFGTSDWPGWAQCPAGLPPWRAIWRSV